MVIYNYVPNNKPKDKDLTMKQKEKNRRICRTRVKIENAFAGMKHLRRV